MDPFHLAVEDGVGIASQSGSFLEPDGKPGFGGPLGLAEAVAERRVFGEGDNLLELGKIADPAVADRLVDQRDRSGLATSSQRRWVTPLVLLLNRSGKIPASSDTTVGPQQPRMDLARHRWYCGYRQLPGWPCELAFPVLRRSG